MLETSIGKLGGKNVDCGVLITAIMSAVACSGILDSTSGTTLHWALRYLTLN